MFATLLRTIVVFLILWTKKQTMQYRCFAAFALLLATGRVSADQEEQRPDSLKLVRIQEVIVEGGGRYHGNATEVGGERLDFARARTLGGTLDQVSGIQSSHFGPHSGTPVIRSLGSGRVRLLANGLPANDLSGISPNLNVHADMVHVSEITVLKGNASVLYGGRAIGGAVDMRDSSIPDALFPKKWQARASAEVGSNAGHRQALAVSGNLGRHWAWHLGGTNRKNKNLNIPGNTKPPIAYDPSIDHLTAAMAQVHVDAELRQNTSLYPYRSQYVLDRLHDPKYGLSEGDVYTFQRYSYIDDQDVENPKNESYIPGQDPATPSHERIVHGIYDYAPVVRGTMPNSHADGRSASAGIGYVRKTFRAGVGYRALEGYYGIPGFAQIAKPAHTHTHDAPVRPPEYAPISTRALSHALRLEAAYLPEESAVSALRMHYAAQYADDRELLGLYRVNKFNSNRHALRAEMELKAGRFWKSLNGLDFARLKMEGDGVQRYLPNNMSRETGIFSQQQLTLKSVMMNLGYRHDWASRRILPDPTYQRSRGLAGGKLSARDFGLNHFSSDLRWDFCKSAFARASYSHAERAPEVNELYAGNEHFAIMVEENGDDRLDRETAKSYELGAGLNHRGLSLSIARYRTVFDNYLYLAHTGIARSGGFSVKEWRGADTEISGWEAEMGYGFSWAEDRRFALSAFFDLVQNKNTSDSEMRKWAEGDYMPNLPTSRLGGSATAAIGKIMANASFVRYLEQRYLGNNINPERPMPAYSLLTARLGYGLSLAGQRIECYLHGDNLLNVEARPQNSLLKYLAPLPGRNIALGIKAAF